MKLLRYSLADGKPTVGVTDGAGVASLAHLLPDGPGDMIDLIARWDMLRAAVGEISGFDRPLAEVRVLAPIPRPGKIFGIGLNYADHVAETGSEPPADQLWFTKAVTSVSGPYDAIERPAVSTELDYEAELVFVIGRRCRHVLAEEAAGAIFGYCVGNDVSVRDWQRRTSQFVLGKSFDTHAPFGPWITTADSVDVSDLEIGSYVNGERRQHSSTRHLIFNCAEQVAHLSKAMTLEPGDIIFTGTPGGVGAAMKPPRWLEPGDVVRVEIEKLGFIENTVVDEAKPD